MIRTRSLRWFVLAAVVASACAEAAPPPPEDIPRDRSLPAALEGGSADSGERSATGEGEEATELPASDESADLGQGSASLVESASVSEGGASAGRIVPVARPEHVRGIYLNAWTSGSSRRREALIGLAERTEVNAFVVDIKDATGYVSHDSQVPLAREVGATGELRIRNLPALLTQLREARIYPIARIVVTKDPLLAEGRPDLAIQDSAGGAWLDQDSVSWLNFYDREVWDYHVDLAVEMARAGFPEIQWDYVRFPDAPEAFLGRAVFPGAGGRSKAEAVREFLGYAREILDREGALMTADVFGVTTSYRRDVGIGQLWESFIDRVDVALPMVYPSHYWKGSFGFQTPNAHPYEVVRRALRDALGRSALVEGAGTVRPWLQDFSLGEPPYGAPEVRAQIQATYDAGIPEWILWNPGSRYTEAALIPARGLPSWVDPVIRVGGKVVPVSQRFAVLGEEPPPGAVGPPTPLPTVPDSMLVRPRPRGGVRSLPPVVVPDTGRTHGAGGGVR